MVWPVQMYYISPPIYTFLSAARRMGSRHWLAGFKCAPIRGSECLPRQFVGGREWHRTLMQALVTSREAQADSGPVDQQGINNLVLSLVAVLNGPENGLHWAVVT